jgi:hypothetical protein
MADTTRFIHRENPDGTYDSICLRCFITVDTEHDQDDLLSQEAEHICDEDTIERMEHSDAWLESRIQQIRSSIKRI